MTRFVIGEDRSQRWSTGLTYIKPPSDVVFGRYGDRMRKVGKVQFATLLLMGGLLGSMVSRAQGADLPTNAPASTSTPSGSRSGNRRHLHSNNRIGRR
jgi:hypothetical protein